MQVFEDADNLSAIELCLFEVEVLNRPVVSEQIASPEQLCQEVDVSFILQEAVIIHLMHLLVDDNLTMNGCSILSRIFFSFSMWSTCLLFIISAFFIVFIAYLF